MESMQNKGSREAADCKHCTYMSLCLLKNKNESIVRDVAYKMFMTLKYVSVISVRFSEGLEWGLLQSALVVSVVLIWRPDKATLSVFGAS